MHGFTTRVALTIACTAIAAFAGCRSISTHADIAQNASPVASGAAQQLILKLKSPSTSGFACVSDGIAALGAAVGVALKFIRPMSGDACVVQLAAPGPNELAQGYARLKRHPAVEWVEVDAVMKAL